MRLSGVSNVSQRFVAWPRAERAVAAPLAGDLAEPPPVEKPQIGLPLPTEPVEPGAAAASAEDDTRSKESVAGPAGAGEGEAGATTEAAAAAEEGKPKAPNELTDKEQSEVANLSRRDAEVRAHEAAHQAAAGSFGGGASFEYATGPDGKRYAVGGEVPVRIVGGRTPEEAIRNASQVRAAALAPADPSAQDMAVAAEAASIEAAARAELAASRAPEPERSEPKVESTRARPASALVDSQESLNEVVREGETMRAQLEAIQLDPDETARQLEQERRATRGQWRHLHLSSGCGSCSAAAATYR